MPLTLGNVALFGGSFDPPHSGHLEVASIARQCFDLNRVIFVPCQQSPHKHQATRATGNQRLELLEILTANLHWAEVSDFELARPAPSYSWITAKHFAARLSPDSRLHWILGADQWERISEWKNSRHLAELVHFVVAAREGREIQGKPGYRATPVVTAHPASSTVIRAALAEGTRPPEGWLPDALQEYIIEHKLYGSGVC